jgi:hypothetical protein
VAWVALRATSAYVEFAPCERESGAAPGKKFLGAAFISFLTL